MIAITVRLAAGRAFATLISVRASGGWWLKWSSLVEDAAGFDYFYGAAELGGHIVDL